MVNQNSIVQMLIGDGTQNRTGSCQITDRSAASYIADEEIAVVDASGTVLDTTTVLTKDKIFLVQSQGATEDLIWSDEINKNSVTAFTGKAYTAGTVQIDYIGYNAVTNTGSIDVLNDNDYTIELFDLDSTTFGTLGTNKMGFYTSDSSATQQEIAKGLTESLFTNTRDLEFPAVKIEMVTDTASFGAFTQNVTVVNGSVTVTINAADTALAPVGGMLRIGGTGDTSPVYFVKARPSATSVTLNYPYQGTSGTVLAANIGSLTAVTSYGIRVTGQSPYFVAPNVTRYHVNRWKTNLYRMGSTPVSTEQNATEGSGEYPQIASMEYFLLGNEGHSAREGVIPQVNPRANAVSSHTYSMIYLTHSRKDIGTVKDQPTSYKQLIIAFNKGGGFGTTVTGAVGPASSVKDVLEAWLSSFPSISI